MARVDYGKHWYDRWYEWTDLYCPNCGVQGLWMEEGEGDYYQGPEFVCTGCGRSCTLSGGTANEQALADLRAGGRKGEPERKTVEQGLMEQLEQARREFADEVKRLGMKHSGDALGYQERNPLKE